MRGFEVMAIVIAAFFFIGIGVGVLLVIALPALHRRRGAREIGWDGDYRRHGPPPGYGDNNGPGWAEPPGPDDGDSSPRWPRRRR